GPVPKVLGESGSSVVKIHGVASSCGRAVEGSGFVYAPGHVLTNAHVVAGVTEGQEVFTTGNVTLPARVVLYDPQLDIAVLDVPGLNAPPLRFAGPAAVGADAIVAGYPLDGPFDAEPARIGGSAQATSP